jgi:succinoglycan biosynthesis transport protein ExoP
MEELNLRDIRGEAVGELTLRDVLVPLFRHRRLIALSFCGIFLGGILAAVLLSNRYEANMEILVDRERVDPAVTTEQTSNQPAQTASPVTEEEINSEVQLLQASDLLRQVVLSNGLQEREHKSLTALLLPKRDEETYISKAVERLGKQLKIEPVTKANLIKVSYQCLDPRLCYGVLNVLGSGYLEKHVTVHRPKGVFDFFAKEANQYGQALADSEARLVRFGENEGIVAPDIERSAMAQQVVTSVGALHQAKQVIAADEQRIHDEEAQLKATPARSSAQEASNSDETLLQQLEASLLTAQIKRTQLVLKYDPSYPLVQEADQEIAQTKAAIEKAQRTQYVNRVTDRDPTYELLRQDVAKTQADLAAQRATAATVALSIQSMQREMVDLDQKAMKQADLLRDAKADEANYLLYLSKREQERTSDALDERRIGNVVIAVPPAMPRLPIHNPLLIVLGGLTLATFVSGASAFVAEYLDTSFRVPGEVVETLRIPVLASLPRQSV